jgi:hypothetical protein
MKFTWFSIDSFIGRCLSCNMAFWVIITCQKFPSYVESRLKKCDINIKTWPFEGETGKRIANWEGEYDWISLYIYMKQNIEIHKLRKSCLQEVMQRQIWSKHIICTYEHGTMEFICTIIH